jgi:hypothetical protein
MIEKLPPAERAEVVAFVRKAEPAPADRGGVRYLPQAEAERIAEQVFDKHHELFRRLAQ